MNSTIAYGADLSATVPLGTTDSQRPQSLSEKEFLMIWIMFGMIWGFGLIANLFTAVALTRTQQTPLNVIMISLCFSDIVSTIASPFIVGQILNSGATKDYPWNVVICKTAIPLGSVTGAVTIQLVLALSLWRLHAIRRPHKAIGFMTLARAKQVVILAWMVSIVMFMPPAAYFLDIVYSSYGQGKQICFTTKQTMWIAYMYNFIDLVIMTLIPITLIFMLCVAIGFSLLRRNVKRQEITGGDELQSEDMQALFQLSLIVVSFLIGYLPKIFHIISYILRYKNQGTMSYLVSRGLLNVTESLNPLVYNLRSRNIRSSTNCIVQRTFRIGRHHPENKRDGNSVEIQCNV